MMKRIQKIALVAPLLVSLCCGQASAREKHNDGFINGVCMAGAALLGIGAVAAVVDWCCSETDEQCINRIESEYHAISAQYLEDVNYFARLSGVNSYAVNNSYAGVHAYVWSTVSEQALYDFASLIWNRNISQQDYYTNVSSARHTIKTGVKKLSDRINSLERKKHNWETARDVAVMSRLLNNMQGLLGAMNLLADGLDHHRSYFRLYDCAGKTRNNYVQEITIVESGRYGLANELIRHILWNKGREVCLQYPLLMFVDNIQSHITQLQSDVRYLRYTYPSGRAYAERLLRLLIEIKNIVVTDSRYRQELYEKEQARLQQLQLEALRAQAKAERQRADALYEQNRILAERNRIEYAKLAAHNGDYGDSVAVTVTLGL
jgi:hypothetical protein